MNREVLRRSRCHVPVAYVALVGSFAIAIASASCVAHGWCIRDEASRYKRPAIASLTAAQFAARRQKQHLRASAFRADASR
jgi:hypothetical protein